ncbi:MAG: DUF4428 domain-containing protein [Oscillospiraceae bacterium]|nr:DUF4428 domain-containing protein [Oscillospiraceae bacterium]
MFGKKSCDICNGKIGVLGNRKLEDGNCCKDCVKQLSPFFSERRKSTVADINAQLAYREENKAAVAAFRTTRTLGQKTKVLLDEEARKFIVSSARRIEDENPDVLDFSQVTGCNIEVNEHKRELKQETKDGREVSFTPPRFRFMYDFECIIHVHHPWINEIRFKINDLPITGQTTGARTGATIGSSNHDYRLAEEIGNEIKAALTAARQAVRDDLAAANQPKVAQTCSQCRATSIPNAQGCCEYCGNAM